ncbi:VOC family protein, partial [Calditrichota bacterium]
DWRLLSDFYIKVFKCKPVPPERKLQGEWLEKGTGVKNAALHGIHLLLPGYYKDSPTLEIFQYQKNESKQLPLANREGFGHIAFSVDDVEAVLDNMISLGGRKIGNIVRKEFNTGTLTFIYAADPENNIIELQKWESK